MHASPPPSHRLLTNDNVELVARNFQLPVEALRYTYPGMRGLFGGIWRTGRTFLRPDLGCCFGPEIFYVVGETDNEAQAAFETSRATMMEREANVARAALSYAQPTAVEFGGDAFLSLAQDEDDRHLLQVFIPMQNIIDRLSPKEWFGLWKDRDLEFRRRNRADSQVDAENAA